MADSILRLKVDSQEYDAKIKRASQGLQQYVDGCRKAGGTLEVVEKETLKFVQSLGQMQTVSNTARGKLGELKQAFVELSAQYKRLTDEEKKGDFGRALKQSLDDLKPRIATAKKDLADIDKELNGIGRNSGQFGGMLDSIGSKLGINGSLTEMLTSKTALMTAGIAAAGAAAYKAAEAFASYNSELAKQDQITTVTTGLQGADADKMSDAAAAISKVYGADFREVINAANTLMTQFGESGDNAMQLIRDGMQGMIQGDGGKLLSMIQQYAPSFRDAGISASQLVAIIQNSEGGIFTDQNMNAISMGIKNIRLMTNATSEALAKLGIDGEEMSRKLNDGSMTIFEALQKVAGAIDNVGSGSDAAGAVMQQVFGRQGAMAGTKLGEAIATLNTNLEETKKQTGEVGESFARLEQATEKFNNQLRETFGYKGWEEMTNSMKSSFYEYTTDTMKGLDKIKQGIKDTADFFHDDLGGIPSVILGPISSGIYGICDAFDQMEKAGVDASDHVGMSLLSLLGPIGNVVDALRNLGRQTPADILNGSVNSAIYNANKARLSATLQSMNPMRFFGRGKSSTNITPITTSGKGGKGGGGGGGSTKLTPAQQAEANMAKAEATYTNALADAEQKVIVGLMTEEDLQKTKLKLLEQIADANLNAWHLSDNDKYLTSFVNFANAAVDLRQKLMSVDDVFKQLEKDFPTVLTSGTASQSFAESMQSAFAGDKGFGNEEKTSNLIQNIIKKGLENGVDMSDEGSKLMEMLFEGMDVPDDALQEFVDNLNEKLAELDIDPIEINIKTKEIVGDANKVQKAWKNVGTAIGQAAGMFSQIENPAAKIMGTIGQAVATVALAYADTLAKDKVTKSNVWAFIAAAAAATVSMITTISSIKSNAKFSEGGIIQGNSYSGDNILGHVNGGGFVGLNAQEIVLNKAQQGNLATQLSDNALNGGSSTPYVMGEQIYLGLNTYLKRKGQGELVTSKR